LGIDLTPNVDDGYVPLHNEEEEEEEEEVLMPPEDDEGETNTFHIKLIAKVFFKDFDFWRTIGFIPK
jgi:hypothetical protein